MSDPQPTTPANDSTGQPSRAWSLINYALAVAFALAAVVIILDVHIWRP